jgi:hypothetical protein
MRPAIGQKITTKVLKGATGLLKKVPWFLRFTKMRPAMASELDSAVKPM